MLLNWIFCLSFPHSDNRIKCIKSVHNRKGIHSWILESLFKQKMKHRSQSHYITGGVLFCFVSDTSFIQAFLNQPGEPVSTNQFAMTSLCLVLSEVILWAASVLHRISIATICTMKSSRDSGSADEVNTHGAHCSLCRWRVRKRNGKLWLLPRNLRLRFPVTLY